MTFLLSKNFDLLIASRRTISKVFLLLLIQSDIFLSIRIDSLNSLRLAAGGAHGAYPAS